MSIGEIIRERRKKLGYSVDYVAEKLGKNRATIYRYESEEIENLPITVLEPLAKVLKTTPAYLMGWEDEPQESYYHNAETAELAQEIFENEGLKILMSASRNLAKEDLENITKLIKSMTKKED